MLAPTRLPELIPDPGIMAAAVANATTALTKGLSAANQKFVFMLIISSILRSAFQKELKFSCTRSLPRLVREQDHAAHETLELAERESSIDCALDPHGCRCDSVRHRRATGAYARGLLGGNRDFGRNAIQSRRYADAVHRTRSRYGAGRISRSSRGKLFRSKSCRLHARDFFHWPTFVWLSAGKDRLSICQCHTDDHCFDSTNKSRVDRCSP
jgi:hypothetical protein